MKLNQDNVPATLDEAIETLYKVLSEDDIKYLKENGTAGCHFSGGMAIRNGWSLWENDTPFKKDIKKRFNLFGHGDDCSGLIFTGILAKVKGKDVNEELNKEAERYKKHWPKYGIDPETGEEIPNFKPKSTTTFKLTKDGIEEI